MAPFNHRARKKKNTSCGPERCRGNWRRHVNCFKARCTLKTFAVSFFAVSVFLRHCHTSHTSPRRVPTLWVRRNFRCISPETSEWARCKRAAASTPYRADAFSRPAHSQQRACQEWRQLQFHHRGSECADSFAPCCTQMAERCYACDM